MQQELRQNIVLRSQYLFRFSHNDAEGDDILGGGCTNCNVRGCVTSPPRVDFSNIDYDLPNAAIAGEALT